MQSKKPKEWRYWIGSSIGDRQVVLEEYTKWKGDIDKTIYDRNYQSDDPSTKPLDDKYAKNGLRPEYKARIDIRKINALEYLDSKAGKLGVEARQTIVVQAIQGDVNNATLAGISGLVSYEEGITSIDDSINRISNKDLPPEMKKHLSDSMKQQYTVSVINKRWMFLIDYGTCSA